MNLVAVRAVFGGFQKERTVKSWKEYFWDWEKYLSVKLKTGRWSKTSRRGAWIFGKVKGWNWIG